MQRWQPRALLCSAGNPGQPSSERSSNKWLQLQHRSLTHFIMHSLLVLLLLRLLSLPPAPSLVHYC